MKSDRSRAFRLSLLLLAALPGGAFGAGPKSDPLPPQVAPSIPSKAELEALDRSLQGGKGEEVLQAARRFVQQNLDMPRAFGLGPVLGRLALAEAVLGREEDARWHWAVAQGLGSEPVPAATLAGLGSVGAKVSSWTARSLQEVPPGVEPVAPASGDFRPPRQSAGAIPELAAGTRSEPGPKWVKVQLVIDAEGHPREPVAIGPSPRFTYEVLEALRGWRFEPARKGGAAVPALHLVAINAPLEKPLSPMLGALSDLLKLEERLRTGKKEGIASDADTLWRRTLDQGEVPYGVQAGILLVRALAYAATGKEGTAICFSQAAQGLHPPLFDADLSPYGAAGALLEQNRFGTARAATSLRLAKDESPPIEKPLLKSQIKPVYTNQAAKHAAGGHFLISTVIDESGAVRDPGLLGAGSDPYGLGFASIAAVCEWRFDPARRGGQPVQVYYDLTVHFDVSRP